MFYSKEMLAKKGALATVWLAAHMERKLKKEQWLNTSVPGSVDTIINPEAEMALRLVSQLLLGVVRIHSLKIDHLLGDCTQAVQRLDKAGPQQDQNLVRAADQNLMALPKDLDEIEFFQQATLRELENLDASVAFTAEDDDNGLIFLTEPPLDNFQPGSQAELFEAERDEEMEQLLASPEKLRDAARSPSLRRAFEELRAASVGSKTPTQSGRRAQSQGSQGLEEDQVGDHLGVPQPSPAPLMQDFPETDMPDLDMPDAPLPDLDDNLEGNLDAMLPTPTPSRKSGSKSRTGGTPRSKAGSLSGQAASRLQQRESSPGADEAPDLSLPDPAPAEQQAGGMIKHARAPRPRRPRVQVDKDVRVQSRAGQGTADLVRPPTRLTRAALLAGAALPSNPGADADGVRLQHLAVSDLMAPALLALYNRACHQARATPRKRAPAAQSEPQPTPWSAVEQRAQQPATPGPGTAREASVDAQPMDNGLMGGSDPIEDYGQPDTWEPELGTGDMPPDPFASSQEQQHMASPQQAPEASGQQAPSQPFGRSQSTRSRMSLGSPGSLGPIPSSEEQQAADRGSMTARSRKVLTHLEMLFKSGSSKRRRTQDGALQQPGSAVLNPIVEGKTSVDASRWFFELLVLKSQGHIDLQQQDAYGDVVICSRAGGSPSTAAL